MPELTRNCPQCGQPLVRRTQKATRREFLGCSTWPTCDYTEPLPAYFALRDAGAPELPGFGEGDGANDDED